MFVLDFVATVVLTAVVVVNVNAVISSMPIPRVGRLGLAAGVGLWVGTQIALTSAGAYQTPVPYIGIAVVLPVVAAAIAVRWWPAARAAFLGVPSALLVGLNASRIFGAFFLILAADGRLGGPFPQSAGWGDLITGLIALPLALAIARGSASRSAILAWNVFGVLDLIAAVGLGVISGPGSPLQLIDAGVGPAAIVALPWALVPTVLVPFYLITHGVIFLQLRERVTGNMQVRHAA